jgi:hypothetical protein
LKDLCDSSSEEKKQLFTEDIHQYDQDQREEQSSTVVHGMEVNTFEDKIKEVTEPKTCFMVKNDSGVEY